MAQARRKRWVVQEDAVDGSLQANSAMSATEPPRTLCIDQTIIRTTSYFSKQRYPICTGYISSSVLRIIRLTILLNYGQVLPADTV